MLDISGKYSGENSSSVENWEPLHFENPSYSYLKRLWGDAEEILLPKQSGEERHESHETRMGVSNTHD